MRNFERIVILALLVAIGGLVWTQFEHSKDESLPSSIAAAKKPIKERKVIPIPEGALIMGAGRFDLKIIRLSQGQRQTMVRFDSATGDYAVLDTEVGAWIAVELPLVAPAGQYENDAHIRLISDVVFD